MDNTLISEKFYWINGQVITAAIQLNGFNLSIDRILTAVNVAQSDFQGLTLDQIQVDICASTWRNRLPLLIFTVPQGSTIPDDYLQISSDNPDLIKV